MTLPFKPRVAKTICRIDRKTQAVTANVNFEDIDLRINGEGSDVYDYEYMFILHSSGAGQIKFELQNLKSYSRDIMRGYGNNADALATTNTGLFLGRCDSSSYPSFSKGRITGYTGSKRHCDQFFANTLYLPSTTGVSKDSYYTTDTSTEVNSLQFYNTVSETITYTLIITAVPKIQYNPSAILLKDLTLANQTADIIFGGVNDTEGVDDLDGNVYDYYVMSSGLDDSATLYAYINEDLTSNRIRQQLYNNNGSIASNNSATGDLRDSRVFNTSKVYINADTGRKKLTTMSSSRQSAANQFETYVTNPDTSTKMTSLLLRPTSSISGNVQLYAVPKQHFAGITPWTFRQVYSVSNASFAGGNTFEIPSWAMFARIQVTGYSASGSNINIDFDTTTSISKQYLKSSTSSTTASFATNRTIGKIDLVSNIDCIVALKSGANRPMLSKSNYNENTIDINGLWALDSSSNYTGLILNADNTNAMNAEITVSYI